MPDQLTHEERQVAVEEGLRLVLDALRGALGANLEEEELVPAYERIARFSAQAARALDGVCHCAEYGFEGGETCWCVPWKAGVH